jgi:hypothetical protein
MDGSASDRPPLAWRVALVVLAGSILSSLLASKITVFAKTVA